MNTYSLLLEYFENIALDYSDTGIKLNVFCPDKVIVNTNTYSLLSGYCNITPRLLCNTVVILYS